MPVTNKTYLMNNVKESHCFVSAASFVCSIFPFKKNTCYNLMSMKEPLLYLYTTHINKREKENETLGELVHSNKYMVGLLPSLACTVYL